MTDTSIWWKKPRRVAVVIDNDEWMLPFCETLVERISDNGDEAVLYRQYDKISKSAVAFFLSCHSIVSSEILSRSQRNLIVHASALPAGRGMSPLTWQVLEGARQIPVCLLEAAAQVDTGNIIYQEMLDLEGNELVDEMRAALASLTVQLCQRYLNEERPPPGRPQVGEASYLPRRNPQDSMLDTKVSIADQFNQLRVVDNERYPAYFDLHGFRYRLSISKLGRCDEDVKKETRRDSAACIVINGRVIGSSEPPYMVAEISANHLGERQRALQIMREAAAAGADAIKLQTYTADTLTLDHSGPGFVIEDGPWAGRTLHDLYSEAFTPWEWHEELFAYGQELGVTVFSSPFDVTAIDLLESLHCPAYKIASFEIVDLPLIEKAARTGKPLIISTGIASPEEIREAVATARDNGCRDLILLHCVSAYPTSPEESHLLTINSYADEFQCPVGLSDHTLGTAVSVASISLGVPMVEKHFTLRRTDGGLDAAFSLEPDEFKALCRDCTSAWQALGSVNGFSPGVEVNRIFRRSLYVVKDVTAGEVIDINNVRSIRPGWGLAPGHLHAVMGMVFRQNVSRGTPLDWSMLES